MSSALAQMQTLAGPPYLHEGTRISPQLFEVFPVLEPFYSSFEKHYSGKFVGDWMKSHWNVAFGSVLVYILMITVGPRLMAKRERFDLRLPLAAWNAFLSLFSFVGMVRTVPHLLHLMSEHSFKDTICRSPWVAYGNGACGLWVQLFMLSKIPELVDTFFIVTRKRPLIFLHWYHHITVLLYCWHASATEAGAGLYFVAMNYSVHAIMYGYYCLQALKAVPKGFPAYLITGAQIAQMFVGTFVCAASFHFYRQDPTCSATWDNLLYGGLMYGSYLYLFCEFAVKRFIFGGGKKSKAAVAEGEAAAVSKKED